jgi:hypothetical protein
MATPIIRCGKKWRMVFGGMPASVFLVPDGSNTPVGGDLCNYSGTIVPAYIATGLTTTEGQTLRFICADGTDLDRFGLNVPGFTARTSRVPAMTQIGFQGSRVPSAAARTIAFIPIIGGFEWVMSVTGNTAPTLGSSVGVRREAAGSYSIDPSLTTSLAVTVLAIDEEDYLRAGGTVYNSGSAPTGYRNYWVKAATPGGYM